MNKLVIRQVNGQDVLQEVCLWYIAPGHLRAIGVLRQRQATRSEVGMFAAGYGALLRYDQPKHPPSSRCFR
jgi:hypothetical protein